MNAWKENYFLLLNQHVKLYESNGQWMKFDINQVEILDLSILEVDNNLKSFPTCPQFCMIVRVICKWSPPPSLLSLVLSIMIMGFRDREVIAVNPVLSKQKHKCHTALLLQIHPMHPISNFHEYQEFQQYMKWIQWPVLTGNVAYAWYWFVKGEKVQLVSHIFNLYLLLLCFICSDCYNWLKVWLSYA